MYIPKTRDISKGVLKVYDNINCVKIRNYQPLAQVDHSMCSWLVTVYMKHVKRTESMRVMNKL